MDAYMGSIMLWPIGWAPQNWMFCDGSVLQVQQYSALFSLLGATFGGNGTTTFALPDLRNMFPLGYAANGPSPVLGAKGGAASVILNTNQIAGHTHPVTITDPGHVHSVTVPAHTHPFSVPCDSTGHPTSANPVGAYISNTSGIDSNINAAAAAGGGSIPGPTVLYSTTGAGAMGAGTTGQASGSSGNSGNAKTAITAAAAANAGGTAVPTLPPYLALGYIICVYGIYPSRQ